jgi:hypothetical protein
MMLPSGMIETASDLRGPVAIAGVKHPGAAVLHSSGSDLCEATALVARVVGCVTAVDVEPSVVNERG